MLTIEESETSINNEQECSNSSLQLAELEVTKTPRTVTHVSPNGSTVWFPYCEDDKKPFVGSSIDELQVECGCKLFKRIGLLCCHAICVMSARQITQIPKQYILDRWTKLAMKKPIFDMRGNLIEDQKNLNNIGKLMGEVWSEIFHCVGLAEGSESDLQSLLENLRVLVEN
ncbi:unnamed protein product [Amaranthus hypochondriacus]